MLNGKYQMILSEGKEGKKLFDEITYIFENGIEKGYYCHELDQFTWFDVPRVWSKENLDKLVEVSQ